MNDQTSVPKKLVKAVKIDIKNIPTTTHEPFMGVELNSGEIKAVNPIATYRINCMDIMPSLLEHTTAFSSLWY